MVNSSCLGYLWPIRCRRPHNRVEHAGRCHGGGCGITREQLHRSKTHELPIRRACQNGSAGFAQVIIGEHFPVAIVTFTQQDRDSRGIAREKPELPRARATNDSESPDPTLLHHLLQLVIRKSGGERIFLTSDLPRPHRILRRLAGQGFKEPAAALALFADRLQVPAIRA